MQQADLYQLLGVSPTASYDEIKIAYREAVKKHHPDAHLTYIDKVRATKKMQEINHAYAVLRDPAQRRKYDEQRSVLVGSSTDKTQKNAKSSRPPRRTTRFDKFWQMMEIPLEHPFRTWILGSLVASPVVFLLIQADSHLGLGWLTTKEVSLFDSIIASIFLPFIFLNPGLLVPLWILVHVLLFVAILLTIPLVIISEGLKRGFRRKSRVPGDSSFGLAVDLTVRMGSLTVVAVLATIFPDTLWVFLLAFPYSFFVLFWLASWAGETGALIVYIWRCRNVVTATEILLKS